VHTLVHTSVSIRSVTSPAIRTGSVSSPCSGGLADDPLSGLPAVLARSVSDLGGGPSTSRCCDCPACQQPRPASVATKSQSLWGLLWVFPAMAGLEDKLNSAPRLQKNPFKYSATMEIVGGDLSSLSLNGQHNIY